MFGGGILGWCWDPVGFNIEEAFDAVCKFMAESGMDPSTFGSKRKSTVTPGAVDASAISAEGSPKRLGT